MRVVQGSVDISGIFPDAVWLLSTSGSNALFKAQPQVGKRGIFSIELSDLEVSPHVLPLEEVS